MAPVRAWSIGRYSIQELTKPDGNRHYSVSQYTEDDGRCNEVTIAKGPLPVVMRKIRELHMSLGGLEVALEKIETDELPT